MPDRNTDMDLLVAVGDLGLPETLPFRLDRVARAALEAEIDSAGLSPSTGRGSSRAPSHRRIAGLRLLPTIGIAGTAVAAGIAAAVVLLSSGAPAAYAGWTPTPTTPTPAAVAAATKACEALHLPNDVMSGQPPVLTDERGPYTAAVYRSGEQVNSCISDGTPDGTSASYSTLLGFRATPGPDQLGAEVEADSASSGLSILDGLAGSDIAAASFAFAGGETVDATVENGWYFLWWPADLGRPTSVQLTTRGGQTINSQPDGPDCTTGSSTCAFAGNRPGAP